MLEIVVKVVKKPYDECMQEREDYQMKLQEQADKAREQAKAEAMKDITAAEAAKAKAEAARADAEARAKALEDRLKMQGIVNMYACIAYPVAEDEYLSRDSEQFHRHLGFTTVGEFHQCACKFGRWYNMIWMEKIIGEHV